jgi:uncharacterized protein YkwD
MLLISTICCTFCAAGEALPVNGTAMRIRSGIGMHYILSLATLLCVGAPLAAHPGQDSKLLELINAYRADPSRCDGKQRGSLPPLAADSALAQLEAGDDTPLAEALDAAGYQAARAEEIMLSGPPDAETAMQALAQRACGVLLSRHYSAAGVSRSGRDWRIVLAQPRMDPDLGNWREAGRHVLRLVNEARSAGRSCGDKRYEAVPALRWNKKLGAAALAHSRDMAKNNYLSHEGPGGDTAETRAMEEGYPWRAIGENVATGQGAPRQVVDGWLSSPGHCANIMNGGFTETGAAYATNPESDTIIYWTQVFGAPRSR